MQVVVRIAQLKALHSGEAKAEPYLWPFFFKVDDETFAYALKARVATGQLAPDALESRGLDSSAVEVAPTWLHAPGGGHGNLPAMRTGDEVDVDRAWTTSVREGSLVQPGDALVGVAVVLWEEDVFPPKKRVERAYQSFVRDLDRRIERAVIAAVDATPDQAAHPFGYRTDAGQRPEAPFFPEALERKLTSKLKDLYRVPLMDSDDFIGAGVWVASTAELRQDATQRRSTLWTPTTGSQEGSWRLDLAITAVSEV